jgi:hypothetical protein
MGHELESPGANIAPRRENWAIIVSRGYRLKDASMRQ